MPWWNGIYRNAEPRSAQRSDESTGFRLSVAERGSAVRMDKHFYQGSKLPHWQPPEATFFITSRLYGSIPKTVIEQLKAAYHLALYEIRKTPILPHNADSLLPDELRQTIDRIRRKKEYEAGKRYFGSFDHFLDTNLNEPHWLRRTDIAQMNVENIHFYAEKYFDIWAFTIMSNHIHLLLTVRPDAPILWKIMQNMKTYSGLHSNCLLGRKGNFWEEESYDHWLRPGEFERILYYILQNPVKAGIVSQWQDYPWTYCHPSLVSFVPPNPVRR